MTSVQAVFGTQQNIGKGIRAMLITRLAKDNKVVIVERAKLNTLTKEQDMNAGNRVKQIGATFVIGAGDRVRYEHLDADSTDHADIDEVVAALRES